LLDSSASELAVEDFVPPSCKAVVPASAGNRLASRALFLTKFEAIAGECRSTDAGGRNGERNGNVPVMVAIDCIEFDPPAFRKVIALEAEINRNTDGVTAWEERS